jgi:hypothetical protein
MLSDRIQYRFLILEVLVFLFKFKLWITLEFSGYLLDFEHHSTQLDNVVGGGHMASGFLSSFDNHPEVAAFVAGVGLWNDSYTI